jgi:uncharacterized protein
VKNYESLKKTLIQHKPGLKKKYKVEKIGIFGSYARDENKKGSDIDVLVEFAEDAKIDLIKFIELENYISDFLGVKADLVMKSVLKPRIGRRILKEVVYL